MPWRKQKNKADVICRTVLHIIVRRIWSICTFDQLHKPNPNPNPNLNPKPNPIASAT